MAVLNRLASIDIDKARANMTQEILNSPHYSYGHGAFSHSDSSPRVQMNTSQQGQALVLENAQPPLIFTGIDMQTGGGTLKIEAPCDLEIVDIIGLYPDMRSPERTVIYREIRSDSRYVVGVLKIPVFSLWDKSHGFTYKITTEGRRLRVGEYFEKGTIFFDSPSKMEDGRYAPGIEAKTALMTLPGCIQDGCIISESFSRRAAYKVYGKVARSFGRKFIPLNLYGGKDSFKMMPDIGEYTRPDGLLMAFREVNELSGPADFSDNELRKIRPTDRLVYATTGKRCRVDNLKVRYRRSRSTAHTPAAVMEQLKRYITPYEQYHSNIYNTYWKLRRENPEMEWTPDAQAVFGVSFAERGERNGRDVLKGIGIERKDVPIDEFEIELWHSSLECLTRGNKVTNTAGGKTVVCGVKPDEQMPYDPVLGVRAEIISNGDANISRMITTGLLSQIINYAAMHMLRTCGNMIEEGKPDLEVLNYYREYFHILSPMHLESLDATIAKGWDPMPQIRGEIEARELMHYIPADNPRRYINTIVVLCRHSGVDVNKVFVANEFGELELSSDTMVIGSIYYQVLEKTARDPSAVSSAYRNTYNLPAKITESQKNSTPVRLQPTRNPGESESRFFSSLMGPKITTELLAACNSPEMHRQMWEYKLAMDNLSIPETIAPNGITSMAKPAVLLHHILECQGEGFARDGERV